MKQFFTAITAYFGVVSFATAHRLWKWLLIPSLIGLVFYVLIISIAWTASASLAALFTDLTHQFIAASWQQTVDVLLVWVFRIVLLAIVFVLYKVLLMNLMAPVLLLVSNHVHHAIFEENKGPQPFHLGKILADIAASVFDALRILIKELALILIFLVLSLIFPVLAPLFALLILAIESYFIGIAMLDFISGYRAWNIPATRKFRLRYRKFAFGNGIVFSLIFLIPFLGVLIAPAFAMVAAGLGIKKLEKAGQ